MKRLILAISIGLVTACSGGGDDGGDNGGQLDTDYAPSFAGDWIGDLAMTSGGQTTVSSGTYLPITATGFNTLELGGMCPDGSGTTATVTGPTTFRMNARTCPAVAFTGCSYVVFKYSNGTSSLSNQVLTLDAPGSASGCGQTYAFTIRYTGTRPVAAAAQSALAEVAASFGETIRFGAP